MRLTFGEVMQAVREANHDKGRQSWNEKFARRIERAVLEKVAARLQAADFAAGNLAVDGKLVAAIKVVEIVFAEIRTAAQEGEDAT